MIKPTIGRVVLYNDGISDQMVPGTICYVHNDELINITACDHIGNPIGRIKVTLIPNGIPNEGQAGWMPYQLNQAKKYKDNKNETSS